LQPQLRIDTESPCFACLAFSLGAADLWAATTDNKLERYCTVNGTLLQARR